MEQIQLDKSKAEEAVTQVGEGEIVRSHEIAPPPADINVKKEDLTPTKKLEIAKLGSNYEFIAKVPLDKDSTAEITLHLLTLEEEVKAACFARQITEGGAPLDRYLLSFVNTMATLHIAATKIFVINKGIRKEYKEGGLWEFVKRAHNMEKLYNDFIFPLSNEYVKFRNEASLSFEELKNF